MLIGLYYIWSGHRIEEIAEVPLIVSDADWFILYLVRSSYRGDRRGAPDRV